MLGGGSDIRPAELARLRAHLGRSGSKDGAVRAVRGHREEEVDHVAHEGRDRARAERLDPFFHTVCQMAAVAAAARTQLAGADEE